MLRPSGQQGLPLANVALSGMSAGVPRLDLATSLPPNDAERGGPPSSSLSSRTDGLASRRRKCMAVAVEDVIEDAGHNPNGGLMLLPGQVSNPLEAAVGGATAFKNAGNGMVLPAYSSPARPAAAPGKRKSSGTGPISIVAGLGAQQPLHPQQQLLHQHRQNVAASSAFLGGPPIIRRNGSKGSPGQMRSPEARGGGVGSKAITSLTSPDRRRVEGKNTDLVLPNNASWPERAS